MDQIRALQKKDVKYDEGQNCFVINVCKSNVLECNADTVTIYVPVDHLSSGLWKTLGIPQYQKWLWEKQNKKCAECEKVLSKPRSKDSILHHDPALGKHGCKAVDYAGKTKNRVLCRECHKKHH